MENVKQHLLAFISTYNHGRPVSYPAIDRRMIMHYPSLVKDGKLGPVLDELIAENLIEQVTLSTYQLKAKQ